MRPVAVVAFAMVAAGCGLDVRGLGAEAAGDASAPQDAQSAADGGGGGSDTGAVGDDAGPPPAEAGPCGAAIPPGWSLEAYEANRNPCPAGYGASHDQISSATAGTGACTCDCTVTTPPACDQGTLTTQWSDTGPSFGQCPNPGTPLVLSGGGCTTFSSGAVVQISAAFSASPLPPAGGTCTASTNPDPSKIVKNGVRFCDVPPAVAESLCSGGTPPGFASCILAVGDIPCPAGPFVTRTVIEDDVELVCPACGACTVGGSCTGAQVRFYVDGQCSGGPTATLQCNGTCQPTGSQQKSVAAYEYTAQPQATCQASPAGTATFNPVHPHTVCCR